MVSRFGCAECVTLKDRIMIIKRNVNFFLEKRKKNGQIIVDNVPIRMRVKYNGNRIEFTTGYRIDFAKWDMVKQKVKLGSTNKIKQSASQINADIARYYADIENIFREYELKNTMPNVEQIKTAFQNIYKKEEENPVANEKEKTKKKKSSKLENEGLEPSDPKKPSFWMVFDLFIKECGVINDWTDSTYEKFAAARNHLLSFDNKLTFNKLDEGKFNDYVLHLRFKKNLLNSTISKQLGYLKWFLRWALRKGHHSNQEFELFKPKLKYAQKQVIFLDESEIKQLIEYRIPDNKNYLERVRDVFLFCCFTGLRHSDVYRLRRSDIKDNHFEIVTIKTIDKLIIEFNSHSLKILEKYKDIPFENDKALPVISNQKMNDYLKELCELAGLSEPVRIVHFKGNERIDEIYPKHSVIGTHTGRRSFICNALALGIPVQVVMKWTGHSDYKSMRPYIDVADRIRAKAMVKFDDFLSY